MKACFGLPVVVLLVGGCMMAGSRTDFVPDGRTGSAIQGAIDAAAAAGGGRVVLEKGVYESGTLYLKSHVELHVPEGCVLRGGSRPEDYDDVDDPRITKSPEKSKKAFVACIGCEDVAITGGGVIDGQGVKFYDTSKRKWGMYPKPPHPRTRMIEFVKCRGVRFEDITFKDSPGWTCWMRMCEDFTAERVKIHADQLMINNDGFHIDGCRRVTIRGCDLKTGDDCIVMRAIQSPNGDSKICEDMLVEDCMLDSHCQCIRLGCPSDGTIRNGVFRNLRMSGLNGVVSGHPVGYLQEGDHGACRMENLLVEDCTIDASRFPISFWIEPGVTLGTYGNVTFRNIDLRGKEPITLQGTGDSVLANIVFENVRGTVESDTPVVMKSVRGIAFRNFEVTSGAGKKAPPAVNTSDGWERDRGVALPPAGESVPPAGIGFVKPTLIPSPKSATYRLDRTFSPDEGFPLAVGCPEAGAADWISSHVKTWFGVTPRVTTSMQSAVAEDEGFELSVDERGVRVSAKRLIGVKYALYAFRQMGVPKRGTLKVSGWEMPYARIADAPKMKWRGYHFCGTTKFDGRDVERFLRMAAYYRYNYFILEDHGGIRSDKYPWYSFPEAKITMAEIRRLKAVGDDLGITLVPAINCYGHSAKAFEGGFRHVALDGHPELQPLFEPDYGWNWCVTNPETRKVVKGLIAELHDACGRPGYFHLGFDEAHPPSCRNCATGEWHRHVADYLGDLADFLRERGARTMVWHDQFLRKDDDRWRGFVHEGGAYAEELLGLVPRDVIICDWYYNDGLDDYPTLTYFREKGFRVFTSPWGAVSSWASQKNGGGFTQVAWAVEHGFDGALTTTWGACDREDRDREFLTADFMWGYPFKVAKDYLTHGNDWRWTHRYVATHWRQVGWDMMEEETGK